MKWVLIVLLAFKCHSFLLDSSTKPPPGGSMTDAKYNTLMDMIIVERRSRKHFEDVVSQELLALKKELTVCLCKTATTQPTSNNETETLPTELLELKNKHDLLSLNFKKLEQNNTDLSARITKLEQDMFVAQPSVSVNFTNAKQLAEAIHRTDNKLMSVSTEVEAIKKDFIALNYQVGETTNVTTTLKEEQNRIVTQLRQEIVNSTATIDQKISGNISDVVAKLNNIAAKQRDIALQIQDQTVKLQQTIDKANSKAILRTCKLGSGSAVNGIIQFKDIKTINGINNSDSIKNSGVFTCEKTGLYIVSVYIQSKTAGGSFYIKKNGNIISDAYIGTPHPYATSSVTIVTDLAANDNISVTGALVVYDNFESCLTIVQVK